MHKWIVKNSPLLISVILVIAILAARSMGGSVQSISGLAVAGPSSQWTNLQDISVGTPITSGAAAVGNFLYNGTNYDVQKGDATNGAYVNVKATVSPVGSKTPADAYVVPTDGLDQLSFMMGFNGTTYDRIRSIANNADTIAVTTLGILPNVSYQYVFNGSTWDRVKSSTTPYVGTEAGVAIREVPNRRSRTAINISATGDTAVIAAVGGQIITIYKINVLCGVATTVIYKDGVGGTAINGAGFALSANGGWAYDGDANPIVLTTGNAFVQNDSVATNCSGFVIYSQA
jgi:hypothetical protein